MKKISLIILLVVELFSCRDKVELQPDNFYTNQIPVKLPTDSSWVKNIILNKPLPFLKDSLSNKIFSYDFYEFSRPIGKPQNFNVFDEIDFSDIIYFQIESVNFKNKNYAFSLCFNANGLKALINKYNLIAKQMYGPTASVGFGIGITNPEGSPIGGFNESFALTSKQGTSINIDLMENNQIIKLQDLCKYYQNKGTGNCNHLTDWLVRNFVKGTKFRFNLYMGCLPNENSTFAYISYSKKYEIDILNYTK